MCMSLETMRQRIKDKFTPADVKMYRRHFDAFDLNGDGVISARELERVSKMVGYRMTRNEIEDTITGIDLDANGVMSFEEFLLAMPGNPHIALEEHKAAEIRRKFMEYDRDHNGFVSVEEAHFVLHRELAFTPEQTVQLVDKYDKNGDGQLCYEEFTTFYKHIRSKARQVRDMFDAFDRDKSGAVSLEEAKLVLRKVHIPDEEVAGLVTIYDKNKDGELQYEEFVAFLLHSR